jgi:threonyl-tRNA synthetase
MSNRSSQSAIQPNTTDTLVPEGYDPRLYRLRHSAAHVMAQAVRERFAEQGDVHFGIGPPIESGFYYDFELPGPILDEDLQWIEGRMREIIRENHRFSSRVVSRDEARELFRDQPFKLELIDSLTSGDVDENGRPLKDGAGVTLSVYQQDDFVDLCRGPHVDGTGELQPEALKLLNTAGAYWRGAENRPMLTRIYGTLWKTKKDLDAFLWRREQAGQRDHRRLGRELELFHLDQTAPGMPYWLPRGLRLLNTLIAFWREEQDKRDYLEISAPLLNDRKLWETSGHWDHFGENMFTVPIDEETTYALKPMNCPNAMLVFNLKVRSYRDLPLRLADCDVLHRHERSGTLHGLLRVQRFQQDDAHIFITEEQIAEEYGRLFELTDLFYRVFGLKYRMRLGTRPAHFIGEVETWDRAEAALMKLLEDHAGRGGFEVTPGDGAFYGPKVDILVEDVIGRSWQLGSLQLDFQLPERFHCKYVRSDGTFATPVVIHRVIYGSLERFIGILIEHTGGAFPAWLAPEQARVVTIADRHAEYGRTVMERLRARGIRCDLDDANERVSAKMRSALFYGIPYVLVVGDREAENGTVSVRARGDKQLGSLPVDDVADLVRRVVDTRSLEVVPAAD